MVARGASIKCMLVVRNNNKKNDITLNELWEYTKKTYGEQCDVDKKYYSYLGPHKIVFYLF